MKKYQITWKQLQNKKFAVAPLSFKFVKTLKEWRKINKKSKLETVAEIHSQKIITIEWQCVNCGCWNILNVDDGDVKIGEEVDDKCENCKKKHKLEIISDF